MPVDEAEAVTEKGTIFGRDSKFCPCSIETQFVDWRLSEAESVPEAMARLRLSVQILGLFLFCSGWLVEISPVEAFTGTYGINYGRIADNLPSPDEVVRLLRQSKIRNVRIYDFNHTVLKAFSGSGLELVIGLPNENLKEMSSSSDRALTWVKDNVEAYLPGTRIVGVAIGNEVLGGANYDLYGSLLGAAKNIHSALEKLGLETRVQVSTAHSEAVLMNSYPPSSCRFSDGIKDFMKPLLEFFEQVGSPFCLNAYPFLDYKNDPDHIDMNYALFKSNQGIYDPITDLRYDNMLDAQIDAAYAALLSAGFRKTEVIITETGWASKGDNNEPGATVTNARIYNFNLRKRLAKRKGTPLRPKNVVKAYIFALFNEDSKPGPTSERNFGLFKPDGSIVYDVGFRGLESSSSTSKVIQARGPWGSYGITLASSFVVLLLFYRL